MQALTLSPKCTRRRKLASILVLAGSIVYAALSFHPQVGCLLVKAWTAFTVILLGALYYYYTAAPCQDVKSDEKYREEYLKAPIG